MSKKTPPVIRLNLSDIRCLNQMMDSNGRGVVLHRLRSERLIGMRLATYGNYGQTTHTRLGVHVWRRLQGKSTERTRKLFAPVCRGVEVLTNGGFRVSRHGILASMEPA